MSQQIFYDPQRRRWKRLRRVLDVAALLGLIVGVIFIVGLLRVKPMKELLLPATTHNYRALDTKPIATKTTAQKLRRAPHRKTDKAPSDITLNSGEGLRAAYYVEWDPSSYPSLKQHIKQIDLLFPDWLHVVGTDGDITANTIDNVPYSIVDRAGVHGVDRENKVARAISDAHEDTEVFPLVNNFDPRKGMFVPLVGDFLGNDASRARFVTEIDTFLAKNTLYRGIALDLEEIPTAAQPGYRALIEAIYNDFHRRNLKLYINTPVSDPDYDLKFMADHSDGLMIMNYDEHQVDSQPGPIASQDWFIDNLKDVLKVVPKEKIICSLGSYGYDWTTALPPPGPAKAGRGKKAAQPAPAKVLNATALSTQEAWQAASDADAQIQFDPDAMNAHFAYDDEDAHVRHQVWFLDGVTVLNEMRAARALGIQTIGLWRLGSEDDSLWKIWDKPQRVDAWKDLAQVEPGYDVDDEGEGDIMRVTKRPQSGQRTMTLEDDDEVPMDQRSVVNEQMKSYPLPYTVQYVGYNKKKVALSFDDGPDPEWTPKILDVLKKYNVSGTFFMIGEEAENNVGVMKRVYREGHEIGNHTFTHPDISSISSAQVKLQVVATERLFAAKLGVNPLYFRPPYSIDQEPDTNDQAAPVELIQNLGYVVVGNKIDTDDWDEHPRKSPEEIRDSVFRQIDAMEKNPWGRGSVILLHDGGGDRSATVAALPVLIEALRARGYEIVPVSQLVGQTREQVMVPLTGWRQRALAFADSVAFFFISFFNHFVVAVFFVGDVLMTGRLIIIGLFAIIDRLHKRKNFASADYNPRVAVLIPAYNEELVIVRTIRSVMMSNYKNMHIIVIDDGSKDRTSEVARAAYPKEIEAGRLTVLTKPNGGKADALNYALNYVDEEIYVGIDADGVIARDAISRLVPHFANPKIGAVAGNAKVGNRVNLWTRWQALEYITSQNFERRALDLFDVVMVVPGAIGAWRTDAVKAGDGYHTNTVAEDADLTMNILEQGYSVIYEDQALAFTEAPINADGLMRQRFRWSFGILQAIYKHKGAIRKHRAMGLFALPNILIFQILLPLVSPLIDLMFVAGIFHYFIDHYFHPESASTASLYKLIAFFLTFTVIDFAASAVAFALERKHQASKGDWWLLFHIWIQRFTYRQVFSLVLLKTVKRAVDGKPFNWDKLDRTAKMSAETEKLTAG